MWLKLACRMGKHRRSRSRAWHDAVTWRSYCSGCGQPMIKDYEHWRLLGPEDMEPVGAQAGNREDACRHAEEKARSPFLARQPG